MITTTCDLCGAVDEKAIDVSSAHLSVKFTSAQIAQICAACLGDYQTCTVAFIEAKKAKLSAPSKPPPPAPDNERLPQNGTKTIGASSDRKRGRK